MYANPQLGVFSLQTLFVLIWGTVVGIKYSIVLFIFLGYLSMYILLKRYFKLETGLSVLLSLLWILSSFYVNHLPSHVTFVWYLTAPFYIYLALRMKNIKDGALFGLAFAIMGLGQLHNPFFMIGLVCLIIFVVRIIKEKDNRIGIFYGLITSALVFLILAGQRTILTVQNVLNFPRHITDPAPSLAKSVLGLLLPFSRAHNLHIVYPITPFGWGEMTATIGMSASIAFFISVLYFFYSKKISIKEYYIKNRKQSVVLLAGFIFFIIGCGSFASYAPYHLLKLLPIFGIMRVSSRWFLGADACMLIFIGLTVKTIPKKTFLNFLLYTFLFLGISEMFLLNWGYQANDLTHVLDASHKSITSYQFQQFYEFGDTLNLPGGGKLHNDGHLPHFYREYEGLTYNMGVLHANDALIDINTLPTPRCSWAYGCNLVLTQNAKLISFSPNKMVFERTGPGSIELNMNDSNYFVVNGYRDTSVKVAEPYNNFYINVPNSTKYITVKVRPSMTLAIKSL